VEHIAIDLGGRESQVCIRGPDGRIVKEGKQQTGRLEWLLGMRGPSRVILETSAEAFKVADAALAHGHEVRVVPATLVKALGVGARRTKTDERDARTLSEVSCRIDLPSVHIPSQIARERRSLSALREGLVSSRTQLINSTRGYLRTQLLRVPGGRSESFPARVRKKLLARPEGMPVMVERTLSVIECLNEQIADADKELEAIAQADPVCCGLMTMPGVGPVTAIRFAAAIDQMDRFASAHHVEAYLGITPGENSSSERKQRTGSTKAGPPQVRRTLVQAAWCLWRVRPEDPAVAWAREVAKRRGMRVAIVALARKMAGILFAMWRDGTNYDPLRGAKRPQA
jgi:transposase